MPIPKPTTLWQLLPEEVRAEASLIVELCQLVVPDFDPEESPIAGLIVVALWSAQQILSQREAFLRLKADVDKVFGR